MTLLKLTGITKSFGAVDVLHGVDLSVAAGEVVGLVGDNGAGKSTLMKTITGIYQAGSGTIELDGESILHLDPGQRRRIGIEMIYQDRLGAHLPSINRPVGTFSGGQQQTVAIARALTFNPKLVIMDEPTAALAVREVQSVLDLIRRLKSEGIAVILISHRLNDVLSVTDRIVVLRHGTAAAELTTADTDMNEVVAHIVGARDAAAAEHEMNG